MSSRTLMRQQIERQKVLEEEKSRDNVSKVPNDTFTNSYKNINNDSSPYCNNYLPSLSQPVSGVNQNFEYCDSYSNNPNNIQFNQDLSQNYIEFNDYISDLNGQRTNLSHSYIIPPGYQFDKYSLPPYNSDFLIDNKVESHKLSCQYELSNTSHPLPHDIDKNNFSLSCPVTGEQSDISINHTLSSGNFVQTQSSSVQGPYNVDERRHNQKDRNKKESHNRIERKRRDFINQQITELSHLIPPQMITDGESKKNKGNILKNSVDYISHLQNEMNNVSKYIKETELAFILIENLRKRNQELEFQINQYASQNLAISSDQRIITSNYNNYIVLHEQNLRFYQANGKFSSLRNTKPNTPDTNRRVVTTATNKQQASPPENGIAFKIEPSSAHSSLGNNSLSTTYRIEEETDLLFSSVHEINSPRNNYQNNTSNQTSLPSIHSDAFFSSSARYRCMENHNCESMEC